MGIEVRNGRRYVYAKRRVGNRVVSVYGGRAGDTAAATRRNRSEPASPPSGWEALAQELRPVVKRTKLLVTTVMEAAGFHRHKRGAWRLRRNKKGDEMRIVAGEPCGGLRPFDVPAAPAGAVRTVTDQPPTPAPAAALPSADDPWAVVTEYGFGNLIKRIDNGDRSALPEVRKLLMLDPIRAIELLGGNLARTVEEAVVVKFYSHPARIELVLAQLDRLRAELSPPTASALERLAAQEVVSGWLLVQALDLACLGDEPGRDKPIEALRRERARAHKQYQSALRTLAVVSRRPAPNVQVNVKEAKVNIAEANVMAGR